jgi:hypothetical protein
LYFNLFSYPISGIYVNWCEVALFQFACYGALGLHIGE